MATSQGSLTKFAIGAAGTAIGSFTNCFEARSTSLARAGTIIDTSGIRGTRSHHSARTRAGTTVVSGQFELHPTPGELDWLFPWILGADASGDTFALAESLQLRDLLIDRVPDRFLYTNCVVSRAVFSAEAGHAVVLVIEIEGQDVTRSATAFPSISPLLEPPYVIMDGVLTLAASARKFNRFELTIDNLVQTDRFMNSTTRADIPAQDREIRLSVTTPYTSDETDLLAQATAGAAGSLVFTNGGYSTTFAFAALQVPPEDPVIPGKSEILLTLNMVARMAGTTKELVVTHDATA